MSYTTRHELVIDFVEEPFNTRKYVKIVKDLREFSDYAHDSFDENGNYSGEWTAWENINQEMVSFSRKYPDVLFIIEGWGDEYDNVWRLYVMDGKSCRLHGDITFKQFEMDMLKERV